MKDFVLHPQEVQHAIAACIEERDRLRAENERLRKLLRAAAAHLDTELASSEEMAMLISNALRGEGE